MLSTWLYSRSAVPRESWPRESREQRALANSESTQPEEGTLGCSTLAQYCSEEQVPRLQD